MSRDAARAGLDARPGPRQVVAAVGSGIAWVVALPPIDLWWAGVVSVGLLGLAVRGCSARRRALLGGTVGLVVFGVTLRWATIFTVPGYVLLVLIESCFLALAGLLVPRSRRWPFGLVAAVTTAEWLRHRLPLSGLPMSSIALGQTDGPVLSAGAFGGPPLITLTIAVAGALLASGVLALVRGDTTDGVRVGVSLLAVLLVVTALPSVVGTTTSGDRLVVAAVQGGGRRGLPAAQVGPTDVLARHLEASTAIGRDVELVLWPENVVDLAGPLRRAGQVREVASLAERLSVPVIAGVTVDAAPTRDGVPGVRRFRNLAVAFESDGTIGASYDKVVRVPFGEYVPLRTLVDRVADLSLIPREAVAGAGPGVLDTSVGRLGVMVSFENLFAQRARGAVASGAELLVVPTNAASYVTDDVPRQQLAAARLRAVETGRWLALAGPTGPTAVVGPDGSVEVRTALEEQAVVEEAVQPRTGRTPYGVLGDPPTLTAAALLLTGAWMDRGSRRRRDPAIEPHRADHRTIHRGA